MIKTKTICTIGPSSDSEQIIEKLILGGMDIVRLNFSHSSFEQFNKIKNIINNLNFKHKKSVKILIDLQGPRMRVGILPLSGIELKEGEKIVFSTKNSNDKVIHVNDPYLHIDVKQGQPIYLSNGEMELMVTDKKDTEIEAIVIRGGILYSKKGLNVPETNLTSGGLTDKDKKDIKFAVENNVDFIALSFVKDKSDIEEVRSFIDGKNISIIAKIERKQAILNLDEIIIASDLIMVARGDLGIEMPLVQLPVLQKKIINESKKKNVLCIVATQMLASMVNHHRPTNAEVTDVANAVIDGAWGLMLSDETAFGKYPSEALKYLVQTIEKTEEYEEDN
ncbi:MAG: pyruvate kinase [Candidatus Levybacteria bacterium]|nr:pyruvate kinase [Candidatus Levybacteria bacterium]